MTKEEEQKFRIDAAIQSLNAQLGIAIQQNMNLSGEVAVLKAQLAELTKEKSNAQKSE